MSGHVQGHEGSYPHQGSQLKETTSEALLPNIMLSGQAVDSFCRKLPVSV